MAMTRTDGQHAPTQHEQREHPRLPLPVGYASVRARRERRRSFDLAGHAYDLSWGGLRFELDEPIDVGESFDLEVELPGDQAHAVRLRAICIRHAEPEESGPTRMAAAIVGLPNETDRRALADYLDARLHARKAG